MTGNPEADNLVKDYDEYVQTLNEKRLGICKFGPYDQLETRRIQDLNDRFDKPTIHLAKKFKNQLTKLEEEAETFTRHV